MPLSYKFHSTGDPKSLPALSLRKPHASATAILGDKFNASVFERGYERCSGFGSTTYISIGGLKPLDRG